jgi:Dolichyl-phosphate-mannose-protein mannosyltransferase
VLLVLAAGFLLLGGLEAWHDSPTFDEPVYVSAGLAAIQHQDLTLNEEHPPLMKVIAALPVLLTNPVVPANGAWNTNDEHTYSGEFLSAQVRAGKVRDVTFASRLIPLLATAALALVLFGFANELFGGGAGLLAGALWLACPLVLGLGHLDGVDAPFALSVAWFAWALLRWTRVRSRRRLVVLGVAGGLTALADASGLLILAIGAATVAVWDWRTATGQWRSGQWRAGVVPAVVRGAAVVLVGFAVIWLAYAVLAPSVLLHPTLLLLPRPYVNGLRYLRTHDTIPASSYLLGHAWTGARWWYWPISLAIKLPPATLAVLVLGLFGLLGVAPARRVEALVIAGLPAAALFAFNLNVPRDIGIRYLLPVIALWLVVASGVASRQRSRVLSGALILSGALGVLSVVSSYPNSLAWTSPAFAAPYRVATNSSVDWGQDLYALQHWSATHDPRVAYFGPRGITVADIPHARSLFAVPPTKVTGWVAASATDLTTGRGLSWLRAYCPVGTLGQTILLYHFASAPSGAAGPLEPPAVCRGANSRRVK